MVKQEAKDATFGARLFYNGLMIFIVAIFLYYDNNLQKSILNFDILYFLPYFALFGASYYFYYVCGANPGFVELPRESERDHVELSIAKSEHKEGNETLLPSATNGSSEGDLERGEVKEFQEETRDRERINKRTKSKAKKNSENDLMPEMRYCEICDVTQPYRTKHCDKCERCVNKFDHHCFWIGGCVGELNHGKFWLFLFFQTILELWSFFIADSGLDASYSNRLKEIKGGKTGDSSPYTSSEYGAFTAITFIVFLAFIFTGALLGFHTFLILTNQTTWEYTKKERITYLKIYPKSMYPFSQGLLGNIKLIFFHGNRTQAWELPPPVEIRTRNKGFNWFENEYWTCC